VNGVAQGVGYSVLGIFVHRDAHYAGTIPIPWGAILSVAAVAAGCRASRHTLGRGGPAGAIALSWLAVTTIASQWPGDILIANDALGVGYILGGALIIGIAATWPSRAERQRSRGRSV
jgi:hypothetical protein